MALKKTRLTLYSFIYVNQFGAITFLFEKAMSHVSSRKLIINKLFSGKNISVLHIVETGSTASN